MLAAPFVGSFLGVLIRRIPDGRPVLLGRSACEACGHALGPMDLVPLVSFAVRRGRCGFCGAAIAALHWQVELAAVAVAVAAALFAEGDAIWVGCALGWPLLALAWIDAETMLLPDALTLPLIVAGLVEAWWLEPWFLTDRAVGAIVGYAAFRAIEIGYRRLRGQDGLGQGDAKLLAAGGAWLGWEALPWVVVLGALGGLLVVGGRALAGRQVGRATELPFGPPLAAGIFAMWLALQGGW